MTQRTDKEGVDMEKLIGILTSGGDTPGLNAAIRAIGKTLNHRYGYTLIGFNDGFRGLMENRFIHLNDERLSNILTAGGTILGSSRDKPNKMPVGGKTLDMTPAMVENYHKNHLSGLICLGGGGTQKNAYHLAQAGLNIMTLPKTIDNDVVGTDVTFGFDTALSIATEAVDRLHSTASSHHRVIILETMGHRVGWLALEAGVAGGADVILLPELPFDEGKIAEAIMTRTKQGKRFSIVVVAEGAVPQSVFNKAKKQLETMNVEKDDMLKVIQNQVESYLSVRTVRLAEVLEKQTGKETRVTILGHVQRGGTPSARDRVLSTALGARCAQEVAKGAWGYMMSVRGTEIVPVPLEEVVTGKKYVPEDHYLVQSARDMGICLGI